MSRSLIVLFSILAVAIAQANNCVTNNTAVAAACVTANNGCDWDNAGLWSNCNGTAPTADDNAALTSPTFIMVVNSTAISAGNVTMNSAGSTLEIMEDFTADNFVLQSGTVVVGASTVITVPTFDNMNGTVSLNGVTFTGAYVGAAGTSLQFLSGVASTDSFSGNVINAGATVIGNGNTVTLNGQVNQLASLNLGAATISGTGALYVNSNVNALFPTASQAAAINVNTNVSGTMEVNATLSVAGTLITSGLTVDQTGSFTWSDGTSLQLGTATNNGAMTINDGEGVNGTQIWGAITNNGMMTINGDYILFGRLNTTFGDSLTLTANSTLNGDSISLIVSCPVNFEGGSISVINTEFVGLFTVSGATTKTISSDVEFANMYFAEGSFLDIEADLTIGGAGNNGVTSTLTGDAVIESVAGVSLINNGLMDGTFILTNVDFYNNGVLGDGNMTSFTSLTINEGDFILSATSVLNINIQSYDPVITINTNATVVATTGAEVTTGAAPAPVTTAAAPAPAPATTGAAPAPVTTAAAPAPAPVTTGAAAPVRRQTNDDLVTVALNGQLNVYLDFSPTQNQNITIFQFNGPINTAGSEFSSVNVNVTQTLGSNANGCSFSNVTYYQGNYFITVSGCTAPSNNNNKVVIIVVVVVVVVVVVAAIIGVVIYRRRKNAHHPSEKQRLI